MHILVVEDESGLRMRLLEQLSRAGYAVHGVGTALEADDWLYAELVDAVILDLGLPDDSGLSLLRRWRADGQRVPVIVLTARDAWHERVEGFKAGADDYVGKPFHAEELLARLSVLLRRLHGQVGGGMLTVGDWCLDESAQTLRWQARDIALTGMEFRLLRYLMLNAGRVLSKSALQEHVYAGDADPDSNTVEVYINRLRGKLGRSAIETRRGQGYVLHVPHA